MMAPRILNSVINGFIINLNLSIFQLFPLVFFPYISSRYGHEMAAAILSVSNIQTQEGAREKKIIAS